jgi:hypothetical protein
MLNKAHISRIKPMSDEWLMARRGKLTSSEIHFITGKEFWTTGCQSYIYRKVGEMLTGVPATSEINTEATVHGLINEANAIRKFAKLYSFKYIVCQQLIAIPGSRFGSTPDGIIVLNESMDEEMYNVSTAEVKCPPTYANFISLSLCKTPQDLKAENKQYYWQVLDQMDNCDCMNGYFITYHPEFKAGNMNVIEFRKMQPTGIENGKEVTFPLTKDIAFLKERKKQASQKMDEIYSILSSRTSV